MSKVDFSGEDWDEPWELADGCWVIANRHSPGLNHALELNNRTFVFRLRDGADDPMLFVFGCADARAVAAVQKLERATGLTVKWVLSNGGGHHLFLGLWYEAFPEARIPIPAKRIPFTRNGEKLRKLYPDRWELLHGPSPELILEELGDQIDIAIFDQLFGYKDATNAKAMDGGALDHTSKPTAFKGFALMKRMGPMMKDTSQPNDEVTFFHRATGMVIAAHNYQMSYIPKSYRPPPEHVMATGGFPMNLLMKLMMKKGAFNSSLEMMPLPIADPAVHAATWQAVLSWDIETWTSAHDPPRISGPDMSGEEIKEAIRASLKRTGEDDPTGARLKWTKKHGHHGPTQPVAEAAE